MRQELLDMIAKIINLRELGNKRDARSLVIENNIDGVDMINFYKYTEGTVTRRQFEDITTLMDSVRDEMRDEILDLRRSLRANGVA
ncbi:MAG: hypothetical protein KAH30_02560 [Caldisericia bacterium]|nr:hypothetical protein [Caldisericia bacterium]